MDDGIRASSVVDGGAYVPLPEEVIEVEAPYDDARLNQLGYKQELRRSLSRESTGRASALLEMKAAVATFHIKGVGLGPPLIKTPYSLPHWCAAGETLSICDL
ncbi:hypothetical protein Vadar_019890 [Vaccinium darrowii]|uniref:Uncharacterized protein n=1 Tax=Vaccinium darrowii TaxID=229202 RepID=A0ACB7YX85_9ERIC|nr:hypothetical protein Vadar_019890 [Vaccinium darrowii]